MKRLGIIGGHGPEVSAFFYRSLINRIRTRYAVWRDEDYPHILIYNLPLPEFTTPQDLVKNELEIKKRLKKVISLFDNAGVDMICYPCNTLSFFSQFIKKVSRAKVIDIVEETSKRIKNIRERVVILGTRSTAKFQLYGCRSNIIYLELQDLIEEILKGNDVLRNFQILLERFFSSYKDCTIVLACTELSLIYLQNKDKLCEKMDCRKVIDGLETLLDKVVIKLRENE